MKTIAGSLMLSTIGVCAFTTSKTFVSTRRNAATVPRMLGKTDPTEKFYQLEELEDAESATTEIFLNANKTVTIGETDGPLHILASGTWSYDDKFNMILHRTFKAGNNKSDWTALGEFEFTVVRHFTGELTLVGGCVAVSGVVNAYDEILGDQEVGFFNMLDTTDARYDKEEDKVKY